MEWMTLADSDFWRSLLARVDRVPNTYVRNTLEQSIRKADSWLGDEPLPFHFSHGDFGPWNMKRLKEKVFVFDWEDASKARPPGWDILHFLFQSRLSPKRRPHELCAALFADAVAGASNGQPPHRMRFATHAMEILVVPLPLGPVGIPWWLALQNAGAFPEVQTLAGCLHALNDPH